MRGLSYGTWRVRVSLGLAFGSSQAALRALNAMLGRWPRDRYALASRAHFFAQRGQFEAALLDSHQLLLSGSPDAHDWFNHGFLLESMNRWTEALPAFRRAVDLSPELDLAWFGLGRVLRQLGRLDEAAAAFRRNTELQPMSPHGWQQLARVQLQRRDWEAAAATVQHLRTFDPRASQQLEAEAGLAFRRSA